MKVAAVGALVKLIEKPKKDEFIIGIFDKRIVVEVAFAVAEAAVKSGIAREGFDLKGYKRKLEEDFLK